MRINEVGSSGVVVWCVGMIFLLGSYVGLPDGNVYASNVLPATDTVQTYQSFFDDNPVYTQVWSNGCADGLCPYVKRHGLLGDTLVDGVRYHILAIPGEDKLWWGGDRLNPNYIDGVYWARESENHDKVWVRMPWDSAGRETLVVDMNLKKGDTVQMYDSGSPNYVVDTVYYKDHPGGRLKHIRLKPQSSCHAWTEALEKASLGSSCDWKARHLEFIEGVGTNLGFIYRRIRGEDLSWAKYYYDWWGPMIWYEEPELLADYVICVDKDSAAYYEHGNMECVDCYTGSFEQDFWDYDPYANESVRSLSRYLRVSPNPAQARVALQWASEAPVAGVCRIELYTLQGVRLRSFTTDSWPYTLHVSDMPHGTYMLRVSPEDASAAWQATARVVVL